jgi:hypothetical protein
MNHPIKEIAKRYSELSDLRKDKKRFVGSDFIQFAKDNKNKYYLIENGDDLLVSTWHSNDLIEDYQKTL